jgi:ATP-binding cassette subfamily B protein
VTVPLPVDAGSDTPTTLWGTFRRHLPAFLAGSLMLLLFQIAMNRIDRCSIWAIDAIFQGRAIEAWKPGLAMLLLALFAFGVRVTSRWFMFNAGRDVEYELRGVLLERLHRLGAAFYRRMSSGDIMSRSTSDLQQVRLLFGFGVLNIVNVVFAFGSAMQIMVSVSVKLTLVSFANVPLLVIATRSLSKGLYTRTRDNQETLGRLSETVQRNLAGIRVVRAFGLESFERKRFERVNADYLTASLALARLRGSLCPMVGAISASGVLLFFWYGATLLLAGPHEGGISHGQFFAFWQASMRMAWPMLALGFSVAMIQRGRAGFARLKEIFDAQPEIVDGSTAPPARLTGSIGVRNLTFAYGGKNVLNGVTFDFKAGESVAIVGKTGAGKSTLAMLLAHLLPTPPGTVFLDDFDVCDLPIKDVRQVIGFAQQDAFLFSNSVARNIAFALESPDSPEAPALIERAAREAHVYDDVQRLPEQFDTVVGERGVQVSGGQKQRIALARALLLQPKVLILDDPLSAVDAKTEASILQAIEAHARERTVILITHRVAAAARCDRIVVLDDGAIAETGTHEQLVAGQGLYAAFAEQQRREIALDALSHQEPG